MSYTIIARAEQTFKLHTSLKDGMNTLGLVVFAMAFGVVLGTIGPRAQVAIELFNVRTDQ